MRNGIERDDDRPVSGQGLANDAPNPRRPYTAPELVEYGSVAKLTQTGGGSVFDFLGMMRMACL